MNFILIGYRFVSRDQRRQREEKWMKEAEAIMASYDHFAWLQPVVEDYKRLKHTIQRIQKGKRVSHAKAVEVSKFTRHFDRISSLSDDQKMICALRFDYFNEIWSAMLLPPPSFIECRELVVYSV